MKYDLDMLMFVLKRIEKYYALYERTRLKNDLMPAMLFINASIHIAKVDIDEAKILLDLNAFIFVDDTKFVSTTIGQAMQFALRNNTLPKSYVENEYITPLGKLEDFLLTSST